MVHEAGHACETEVRGTPPASGWRAAQADDTEFISNYARAHPLREDFAETILPWLALRYTPERVDAYYRQVTLAAIPHRLAYLDESIPRVDMFPLSRSYAVPFFASADRTATGFMRIVNRSDRAGTVRIMATDDMGDRYGPVMLGIGAGEATHLNAADLENGNAGKGLSGEMGDGMGDWWLTLTTTLDIVPLAYVRTPDGFVAPMTGLVEVGRAGPVSCSVHEPVSEPRAGEHAPARESRCRVGAHHGVWRRRRRSPARGGHSGTSTTQCGDVSLVPARGIHRDGHGQVAHDPGSG